MEAKLEKRVVGFPKKIVKRIQNEIIPHWVRSFPPEPTYCNKKYGVPSLIVRIDGTFSGKKFFYFEVEERPTGLGWLVSLDGEASQKLKELQKVWPPIAIATDNQNPPDDHLWLGSEIYHYEIARTRLAGRRWIVRAEPYEKRMKIFQKYAISPVVEKGNKKYGESFGWWVAAEEIGNWEKMLKKGVVLKPKQGSKGKGIIIFLPEERKTRLETKLKKIERLDLRGYYVQRFCPPSKKEGEYFLYELFFGFHPFEGWEFLGGLWVARKHLIITHWVPRIKVGKLEIE